MGAIKARYNFLFRSTKGLILVAIALIDSTSLVPIALLPLAAIMAGKRPVFGALCFISGIFFIYFLAGILGGVLI